MDCVSIMHYWCIPKTKELDFQKYLDKGFQNHDRYHSIKNERATVWVSPYRFLSNEEQLSYRMAYSACQPQEIMRYVDMNAVDLSWYREFFFPEFIQSSSVEMTFCGFAEEEKDVVRAFDRRFERTLPEIPYWAHENSKKTIELIVCIPEQKRENQRFLLNATITPAQQERVRILPSFVAKTIERMKEIYNPV